MKRTSVQSLRRRHERLALVRGGSMIEDAIASLARVGRQPKQIRLRRGFVYRGAVSPNLAFIRYGGRYVYDGPLAWRSGGRRAVPPVGRRPPAARIVSPRGIAFRLYLIALCEAQMRHRAGEYARNTMPLVSQGTENGWADLVVIPTTETRRRLINEKKRRYLFSGLSRLARSDAGLINLPQGDHKRGRFEGFELLDECGARAGGGAGGPYRIPRHTEPNMLLIPFELFSNGWIHVLEDSELQFILMLLALQSGIPQGNPWMEVSESVRLSNFGMSRDGYGAHRTLRAFGLIDMQPGIGREKDGTVMEGYHFDYLYHRFRLRLEGFNNSALEVTFQAVDKLLTEDFEGDELGRGRLF